MTINTPEQGSALATFLLNNASTTFSSAAGKRPKQVKAAACPASTTVADCFATQGENLAPVGQPISAGAVYSLQPGSPNIAGLPAANIANAPWRALASTVSQNDTLGMIRPNALVFALDNLIAATCPGPSYCLTRQDKPPAVGKILQTAENDGIVTVASQTYTASDISMLTDLAHTTGPAPSGWKKYLLVYDSVLSSSSVDSQVASWLTNSQSQTPRRSVDGERSVPVGLWPGFDTAHAWRDLPARLGSVVPSRLAMGTPFRLPVLSPANRISSVEVSEHDRFGTLLKTFQAPLESEADGRLFVAITPLSQGIVDFNVVAIFNDYVSSQRFFTAQVSPPDRAPAGFWVDHLTHQFQNGMKIRMHVGETSQLQPEAAFATVPDQTMWLRAGVTFRIADDSDHGVATVNPQGMLTALKPGFSTVEAFLGKFSATAQVVVSSDKGESTLSVPVH